MKIAPLVIFMRMFMPISKRKIEYAVATAQIAFAIVATVAAAIIKVVVW